GAGLGETGAGSLLDRAIDTAAAEQRLVCRRHDHVDMLLRDVTQDNLDHRHGRILTRRRALPWPSSSSAQPDIPRPRNSMQSAAKRVLAAGGAGILSAWPGPAVANALDESQLVKVRWRCGRWSR